MSHSTHRQLSVAGHRWTTRLRCSGGKRSRCDSGEAELKLETMPLKVSADPFRSAQLCPTPSSHPICNYVEFQ